MTTTHSLGYPRIGPRRELKFALEALWHGKSGERALQETAAELRAQNWQEQTCGRFFSVRSGTGYERHTRQFARARQ